MAYFIAFLATAAATVLLIAPSAYHRIQWRQRDKERNTSHFDRLHTGRPRVPHGGDGVDNCRRDRRSLRHGLDRHDGRRRRLGVRFVLVHVAAQPTPQEPFVTAIAPRPGASKLPRRGGARVGKVGAIRTGADGAVEVLAELGKVLTDPGYRLADSAGHTGSSTLGRGCGSSIATT
jgi:hypothetical protein